MVTLFGLFVAFVFGIVFMAIIRPAAAEARAKTYRPKNWVSREEYDALYAEARAAIDSATTEALRERNEARINTINLIKDCIQIGSKCTGNEIGIEETGVGVFLVKVVSRNTIIKVNITPKGVNVLSGKAEWKYLMSHQTPRQMGSESSASLLAPRSLFNRPAPVARRSDALYDPTADAPLPTDDDYR